MSVSRRIKGPWMLWGHDKKLATVHDAFSHQSSFGLAGLERVVREDKYYCYAALSDLSKSSKSARVFPSIGTKV